GLDAEPDQQPGHVDRDRTPEDVGDPERIQVALAADRLQLADRGPPPPGCGGAGMRRGARIGNWRSRRTLRSHRTSNSSQERCLGWCQAAGAPRVLRNTVLTFGTRVIRSSTAIAATTWNTYPVIGPA